MNEATIKYENNQMFETSLQVAEDFGKQHETILRGIKNIVVQNCTAENK